MPTKTTRESGWTKSWITLPAAFALLFAMGSGPCETCDPGNTAPDSTVGAASGTATEGAGSPD